jgi:hypothetical protein
VKTLSSGQLMLARGTRVLVALMAVLMGWLVSAPGIAGSLAPPVGTPTESVDGRTLAAASAYNPLITTYDAGPNLAATPVAIVGASSAAERPAEGVSGPSLAFSGELLAPKGPVAGSAADAARLRQALQFDEAASVFTEAGGLRPSVIQGARPIVPGSRIGNPDVIKALTADGSNIADWAKFSTGSFQSPSGPFQVHFYRNTMTGATNYSFDYKGVFGGDG